MTILHAILGLAALGGLIYLIVGPSHPSMADEERALRDYFRKRDAAERRGEFWPPR